MTTSTPALRTSMSPFLRRHRLLWSASLLGLLLVSCTKPIPPAEYRAYLSEPTNGLIHTAEVNGVTVTCTYRPLDLLVLQDLANTPTATLAIRDSLARSYAGKTYCTLTLTHNGSEIENQFVNDPTTYQQMLTYLNTGIAADAYLVATSQDSVPAASCMYIRQYGTTSHSTLLLVFDTHQFTPQQGFHLSLHGNRLGLGTLRFPFMTADLAGIPLLKFD